MICHASAMFTKFLLLLIIQKCLATSKEQTQQKLAPIFYSPKNLQKTAEGSIFPDPQWAQQQNKQNSSLNQISQNAAHSNKKRNLQDNNNNQSNSNSCQLNCSQVGVCFDSVCHCSQYAYGPACQYNVVQLNTDGMQYSVALLNYEYLQIQALNLVLQLPQNVDQSLYIAFVKQKSQQEQNYDQLTVGLDFFSPQQASSSSGTGNVTIQQYRYYQSSSNQEAMFQINIGQDAITQNQGNLLIMMITSESAVTLQYFAYFAPNISSFDNYRLQPVSIYLFLVLAIILITFLAIKSTIIIYTARKDFREDLRRNELIQQHMSNSSYSFDGSDSDMFGNNLLDSFFQSNFSSLQSNSQAKLEEAHFFEKGFQEFMPEFDIGDLQNSIKNKKTNAVGTDGAQCSICLLDYIDDKRCRIALCQHLFHSSCIRDWMVRNQDCPLCRRKHERKDWDEFADRLKKHYSLTSDEALLTPQQVIDYQFGRLVIFARSLMNSLQSAPRAQPEAQQERAREITIELQPIQNISSEEELKSRRVENAEQPMQPH